MLHVDLQSFSYSEKEILRNLSFQLGEGDHLAVLGESGCGKSTLLHIIYGLLDVNKGNLSWKGQALLGPKYNIVPGEDFIKLVAQEFNVMPFTTVAENIATYLPRIDAMADEKRVNELLSVVELEDFSAVKVKDLSGGQKQRVALAKALAKKPELILLDEPFSNIDSFRKNKLRRKLYAYLKANQIACITATHDAEEALAFSDQILMLKNGTKELMGTPEMVFNNLETGFQAGFFGDHTSIPGGVFSKDEIIVLPHQLFLSEHETSFKVLIEKSFFKGSHYLIWSKFNNNDVFFNNSDPLPKGQPFYLGLLKI